MVQRKLTFTSCSFSYSNPVQGIKHTFFQRCWFQYPDKSLLTQLFCPGTRKTSYLSQSGRINVNQPKGQTLAGWSMLLPPHRGLCFHPLFYFPKLVTMPCLIVTFIHSFIHSRVPSVSFHSQVFPGNTCYHNWLAAPYSVTPTA